MTINFSRLLARACVYCRSISLQFFFPSRLVLSQISAFCIFCLRAYPCSIHFLILSFSLISLFLLFLFLIQFIWFLPLPSLFHFSSFPSLFAYFYIPLYYNRFLLCYIHTMKWRLYEYTLRKYCCQFLGLAKWANKVEWRKRPIHMCLTFTRKQSNSSCLSRGT